MDFEFPTIFSCEIPANTFISDFGNPCAYWEPENFWHEVSDLGIEEAERVFSFQSRVRVIRKRADIEAILLHSSKYEDVFLRDYDTGRCAGWWRTIDDVPDCVISYIEAAGVNPVTDSLILEVCCPIFNELMEMPCMDIKTIFNPKAYEEGE